MKSFKSLIVLLIIIVLFSENVKSCDSSAMDSGCGNYLICEGGRCRDLDLMIRV